MIMHILAEIDRMDRMIILFMLGLIIGAILQRR